MRSAVRDFLRTATYSQRVIVFVASLLFVTGLMMSFRPIEARRDAAVCPRQPILALVVGATNKTASPAPLENKKRDEACRAAAREQLVRPSVFMFAGIVGGILGVVIFRERET